MPVVGECKGPEPPYASRCVEYRHLMPMQLYMSYGTVLIVVRMNAEPSGEPSCRLNLILRMTGYIVHCPEHLSSTCSLSELGCAPFGAHATPPNPKFRKIPNVHDGYSERAWLDRILWASERICYCSFALRCPQRDVPTAVGSIDCWHSVRRFFRIHDHLDIS